MNEENRKVFLPRPMVSFYSRKISDYLVRPELYSLDRVIGSTKCGKKRCQVCMNVLPADLPARLLVKQIR